VRLYEAKCIHQFDHRYASQRGEDLSDVSVAEKANASFQMSPQSWVRAFAFTFAASSLAIIVLSLILSKEKTVLPALEWHC
jgi:hypothetical protein